MPGCELKVIDDAGNEVADRVVGQLVFKSASNMTEYYNRPEATAETLRDGWVISGDLGWRDEEGYFYLSGRMKDMIIRGGAKIYSVEVEEVLNAHDTVAGCAVVGKPDDRFGESVIAFVQPRDGGVINSSALLAYCAERLAPYKVPQEIVVVGEFPLGPTGKVLKRVLRDRLEAVASASPQ
jgi:long-chain acyl-CoA synthetase